MAAEFIIRRGYGKAIEIGIAAPGFDPDKWIKANKYWFEIPTEQALQLGAALLTFRDGGIQYGAITVTAETGVSTQGYDTP